MTDYTKAHKYCTNNGEALKNDKICGCFHCLSIFPPSEINDWIRDTLPTARCPYCGIDSVIGESSGYPITREFLEKMNERWFQTVRTVGKTDEINVKITLNGNGNANLILSSIALGMLELIEKGVLSHTDAEMTIFIPAEVRGDMLDDRMKRIMGLSQELEFVKSAIPDKYQSSVEEIKALCFEVCKDYKRDGGISIDFNR